MKRLTLIFSAIMLYIASSCSDNKEYDPAPPMVIEDTATHYLRKFSKRYNLPENQIIALGRLFGIVKNNIGAYTGIKDGDVAIFLCDTLSNQLLYSNFNAFRAEPFREFNLPYGEKQSLEFNALSFNGIVVNSSLIAFSGYSSYGVMGSPNSAFLKYRFLFTNNKMQVIELPSAIETLNKSESVLNWFDNSAIFYSDYMSDYPNYKSVVCYDEYGNLKYEAPYPYFHESDSYDLFRANIIQPTSYEKAIGVSHSNGGVSAFYANVKDNELIWHNRNTHIDGYNHKNNDIVNLTNQEFGNDILKFTIEVSSYNGEKQYFKCAITTDGDITFSK